MHVLRHTYGQLVSYVTFNVWQPRRSAAYQDEKQFILIANKSYYDTRHFIRLMKSK